MNLCKTYYKMYEKSFCKVLRKKKPKIMNLMVNIIFIVKQNCFTEGRTGKTI